MMSVEVCIYALHWLWHHLYLITQEINTAIFEQNIEKQPEIT